MSGCYSYWNKQVKIVIATTIDTLITMRKQDKKQELKVSSKSWCIPNFKRLEATAATIVQV
jgi:hypothetical protein